MPHGKPSAPNNGYHRASREPQTQALEFETDIEALLSIGEAPSSLSSGTVFEHEDFPLGRVEPWAPAPTVVDPTDQANVARPSWARTPREGVEAEAGTEAAGSGPQEGESEGVEVPDGQEEGGPNPNEVYDGRASGL